MEIAQKYKYKKETLSNHARFSLNDLLERDASVVREYMMEKIPDRWK